MSQYFYLSPSELAEVIKRWSTGPFKTWGDIFPNSPNDLTMVAQFADDFMKAPLKPASGKDVTENTTLWAGYSSGIPDTNSEYPTWHFVKAAHAALMYAIDPVRYRQHGLKVAKAILAQVDMQIGPTDAARSTYMPNWDSPTAAGTAGLALKYKLTGATKIKVESGTQEGSLITRMDLAADLVGPLFTTDEAARVQAWLVGQATWLAQREVATPYHVSALIQGWTTGNFDTLAYYAAPEGASTDKSNPIWLPADPKNPAQAPYANATDTEGYCHLYRYASGELGPRCPKSAEYTGNRFALRMTPVSGVGARYNNSYLMNIGKRAVQVQIVLNQNEAGDTMEGRRNLDYGVPSEGTIAYQSHISFFHLFTHDCLSRRGDTSLISWTTTQGCHGTQVAPGGTPKSIRRGFDRYIDIVKGAANGGVDLFAGTVSANTRIREFAPVSGLNTRAKFLPHMRQLCGWLYKFVQDEKFLLASRGMLPGQYPAPPQGSTNPAYANNGTMYYWQGGPFCEMPAFSAMRMEMAGVASYPSDAVMTFTGGGVLAKATPVASVTVAKPGAVRYRWEKVSPHPLVIDRLDVPKVMLSDPKGGNIFPATHRLRCTAVLPDGTTDVKTVDITVPA